ncbi:unnamed protein product [Mytilus coruscus]|uniref:G-protein coupled receptors family 1 profile domain-containing protein n=1 Tax=Mytilus coruscus TaxID=42192 RepID=A0A6J8E276_MYTCO|nr:unnamed protein product [Mytilus coruscus]
MVVQTYRLIVSVHSAKAGFDKGRFVLVLAGCVLVCGIIAVAYILTWSPFVVCTVLDLSGVDYHSYSHFIYLLCTMVAKVSLTWIPIIFVIRHSHYKKELNTLTHGVIEKVRQRTMFSAEYNLDSTDRAVEGEIAVEIELIPSQPVLLSYIIADDAL